jgi:hypothetical protein
VIEHRDARVSLSCLMCGFDVPEVTVTLERLSRAALRDALATAPEGARPEWDAHLLPRCPKCHGRLVVDLVPVRVWRNTDLSARRGRPPKEPVGV